MKASLIVIGLFCYFKYVYSVDNGLGITPQMAWNSWNAIECGLNQTVIMEMAEAIVKTGLADAGYTYVNMDDCWAESRNATGYIQPDPKKFPDGIKALADYVHSLGLKFGLYSDAGTNTCVDAPGSLGYETKDATQYASWGVDYLKYDNCFNDGLPDYPRYLNMSRALNATGRPIFFSLCDWTSLTAAWGPSVANSWRTTTDINAEWPSIMNNIDQSNLVAKAAGPGGWNDPDMLEVGNGPFSLDENQAHFSLWAIAKAPLILGNDIRTITSDVLAIITNKEVIAVNQDPLGAEGVKLSVNVAVSKTFADELVISAPCVQGLAAQHWTYSNNTIISGLNNKCLGRYAQEWNSAANAEPGINLYAYNCYSTLGGRVQEWIATNSTIKSFFQKKDMNFCISRASETAPEVALFACNNGTDPLLHELQQFALQTDGTIQSPDGFCLTISGGQEVWGGPLSNGEYAALLFNRVANQTQIITIEWTQLGLPVNTKALVHDVWTGEDLGVFGGQYSAILNGHAVNMIKVTPAN